MSIMAVAVTCSMVFVQCAAASPDNVYIGVFIAQWLLPQRVVGDDYIIEYLYNLHMCQFTYLHVPQANITLCATTCTVWWWWFYYSIHSLDGRI